MGGKESLSEVQIMNGGVLFGASEFYVQWNVSALSLCMQAKRYERHRFNYETLHSRIQSCYVYRFFLRSHYLRSLLMVSSLVGESLLEGRK